MATSDRSRVVELMRAYCWTCDECGRDNFERAVAVPPESIDLEDLPEHIDPEMIAAWQGGGGSGGFVMAPDQVKCQFCSTVYQTEQVDIDALSD